MKTAMQQLWEHLDDAEQNGVTEFGTQNFKRYIEKIYLRIEKKQIVKAFDSYTEKRREAITEGEQYYNETFKP